jgi:CHASE3 domain sensor protein
MGILSSGATEESAKRAKTGFLAGVKIGKKLYAGFGVIMVLLAAVAGISWNGLATGEKTFGTYAGSAGSAVTAATIDTAMSDSLLAVRQFVATGSDQSRAA